MILAHSLFENKNYTFNTVEEAAGYTFVSVSRIGWCVYTGHKWKGWTFDEID